MARNTPNPDDRSDNVEKPKEMKKNTMGKVEVAEEMMLFAGGTERDAIRRRNAHRQEAIDGFRKEILDEAAARRKGFMEE
ncbi:small acid-soluble spore protein Tlp [Paenisporosarcina indica]|uniref:small acid-soluble spore protein Tlp n=1 Tax=Paenisporosarcina indica TaxID=650093 RepID=UPI00094F735F|nr:small acid-soluble spore protein Tlp [Paenisporosarcina indica]